MENKIRVRHILLFALLPFFNFNVVNAQIFPMDGATWIFKADNPSGMDVLAEKWEYKGDSIVVDGVIKKMKVTTKTVNPGWYPYDTTTVSEEFRNFLYVDDTIWNKNDSLRPVANFSLQVGDSAYSPYHSTLSPLYPLIMDQANNCSPEVQALFFQKGVVIETGMETENNIDARFYKLQFKNELADTIIRKFTERTILTEGYWHYNNVFLSSCSATDFPSFSFLCYQDDFSTNSSCNDLEWFENLNIKEEKASELMIYPNPANEIIKIKTNNLGAVTLNVFDIIGKSRISEEVNINEKNELNLDISELEPGAYLLEVTSNNKRLTARFIKR